jgi:hypothetical protein
MCHLARCQTMESREEAVLDTVKEVMPPQGEGGGGRLVNLRDTYVTHYGPVSVTLPTSATCMQSPQQLSQLGSSPKFQLDNGMLQ